jgi:hypothetical protein
MKRAFVVARQIFAVVSVAALVFLVVLLHSQIENFIGIHPWWQDFLAFLSTVSVPVLAYFELRHSTEANVLRGEANKLREENNKLADEANEQRKAANFERNRANEALARIAENTKRALTKAERIANKLQKYLGSKVQVINADDSQWPDAAEIVEIKDEIVTLFIPSSYISSTAFAVCVHCDYLEIIELPVGSLPLTLKVLKRHGPNLNLGVIKAWDERLQQPSTPHFVKGPNVFSAEYVQAGSSDKRRLDVFESADGSNNYMLIVSPGEPLYGDNKEISRKFILAQLDNQAQGFRWNGGGSGGSKHELYINVRP